MGLFNEPDDNAIPTTNMMPSPSLAPPPLVMRNNQRIQPRAAAPTPSPIYHNVNGYQIDLNHAARQEIFRLPNGKLIQVRKQTAPQAAVRPGILAPRGPQFTIRQANPVAAAQPMTTARMYRPQIQPRATPRTTLPQHRFSFTDGRVVATPTHTPTPPAPVSSASTVFTQQNGSISVARAPQPNTPFGSAKTEFEDKIINGMEICQHTINKMITLSNSTSFKSSHTFNDLKDLYIHLQYLFTYTSGKFKTLQENLTAGMESLKKFDVAKEKDDADELEIVEEKTDVIEVMSDDEEEAAAKVEKREKPGPASSKKNYVAPEKSETEAAVASIVEAVEEIAVEPVVVEPISPMTRVPSEASSISTVSSASLVVCSDRKLKQSVRVKVEKLEDCKLFTIKQFFKKYNQRQHEIVKGSREATPEIPTVEVVIEAIEREKSPVAAVVECIAVVEEDVAAPSEKTPESTSEVIVEEAPTSSEAVISNDAAPVVKEVEDMSVDEVESSVENKENSQEIADTTETADEKSGESTEIVTLLSDDEDEVAETISVEPVKELNLLKIGSSPPDQLMDVDDDLHAVKDQESENKEKTSGDKEKETEKETEDIEMFEVSVVEAEIETVLKDDENVAEKEAVEEAPLAQTVLMEAEEVLEDEIPIEEIGSPKTPTQDEASDNLDESELCSSIISLNSTGEIQDFDLQEIKDESEPPESKLNEKESPKDEENLSVNGSTKEDISNDMKVPKVVSLIDSDDITKLTDNEIDGFINTLGVSDLEFDEVL